MMTSFISEELLVKAQPIQLLALDVDGVLTDGRIFLDNQQGEYKAFHVRDGYGLVSLQKTGVAVALITQRQSAIVERRALELKIPYVYQGQTDKLATLLQLIQKLNLTLEQVAYMGDDLPDLPVLQAVGLSATVKDAHEKVLKSVDWCSRLKGGRGAVRELCDLLLEAKTGLTL